MIKLEFTGTLTAINVIAFKNKNGEDRKRNEYLFKVTDNNYDDMIAVGAIDDEKFSFLEVGDVCTVTGFVRSREYKEKWYTSVTLSYIVFPVERDKKDSNEKDAVKPDGLPL